MTLELSAAWIIFIATISTSLVALYASPKLLNALLFRPYWLTRRHQYHTIVTSGFVHGDFMHLLFNMMTFYFFAFPLERFIGTTGFAILYGAGLLISHLGTYIKHRGDPEYACLGASGAISAVLFAAIVFFPEQSLIILPFPIPIPAPLFGVCYLIYSYWAAKQARGRINHDAHIGGALTGLAFVALVAPGAYPNFFANLF